jgi:hypothetical protein
MPVVLEAVTLGFLIHAKHGGMLRRPQIRADDTGGFAFELGIVAGQVMLQAMGFQASFFPDPMHSVLADSQRCRQFAATPLRGTVAGFLASGRQNPGAQSRSQYRGLLAGVIGIKPIEPGLEETPLSADDGGSRGLQLPLDRAERRALSQHPDKLGAKDIACGQGTRLSDAAEFRMLVGSEGHFALCRHINLEA